MPDEEGPVGFRSGSGSDLQGGGEANLAPGEVRPFDPAFDSAEGSDTGLWEDPNAATTDESGSGFALQGCDDDTDPSSGLWVDPDAVLDDDSGLGFVLQNEADGSSTGYGNGAGIADIEQPPFGGYLARLHSILADLAISGHPGSVITLNPPTGPGALPDDVTDAQALLNAVHALDFGDLVGSGDPALIQKIERLVSAETTELFEADGIVEGNGTVTLPSTTGLDWSSPIQWIFSAVGGSLALEIADGEGLFLIDNSVLAGPASYVIPANEIHTMLYYDGVFRIMAVPSEVDPSDFATSSQGQLADSAVQPGDLPTFGSAAEADTGDFATAAQGELADSAMQPGDGAGGGLSGTYPNPGLNESAVHSLILAYIEQGNGVSIAVVEDKLTISVSALAITSSTVVANEAAMLALTAQEGDIAIRTDTQTNWILGSGASTSLASWNQLLTPTDAVLSVAGKTGTVTLAISDIPGLQTALDDKQPLDTELTALAALTGTAFGRGFITLDDHAALITKLALVAADIPNLAASQITSGQFDIARLASGTPDGTKFINDAGVLATPAGGSSTYQPPMPRAPVSLRTNMCIVDDPGTTASATVDGTHAYSSYSARIIPYNMTINSINVRTNAGTPVCTGRPLLWLGDATTGRPGVLKYAPTAVDMSAAASSFTFTPGSPIAFNAGDIIWIHLALSASRTIDCCSAASRFFHGAWNGATYGQGVTGVDVSGSLVAADDPWTSKSLTLNSRSIPRYTFGVTAT